MKYDDDLLFDVVCHCTFHRYSSITGLNRCYYDRSGLSKSFVSAKLLN